MLVRSNAISSAQLHLIYGALEKRLLRTLKWKRCDRHLWQRFSKIVKPLLLDEVKSSERIILVHEDSIITNADENAKMLNSYIFNVAKQLKISEFKDIDFSAEYISHPAWKQ